MAKRKIKTIPAPALPSPSKKSIVGGILYIVWLLFKWAFVFSSETCINPLTWAIAMILRGIIFYFVLFPYEDAILKYFTLPDGHSSVFGLPVALFFLWYILTSTLMFLGAIYSGFGQISTEKEGKYPEFEKLAGNLNAKMKYQSYSDSLKMLTGKDKK